jgi:hypothetical protein
MHNPFVGQPLLHGHRPLLHAWRVHSTRAAMCPLVSADWNPAMDAQAQDRCHRIGQTREVHIYRLVRWGDNTAAVQCAAVMLRGCSTLAFTSRRVQVVHLPGAGAATCCSLK